MTSPVAHVRRGVRAFGLVAVLAMAIGTASAAADTLSPPFTSITAAGGQAYGESVNVKVATSLTQALGLPPVTVTSGPMPAVTAPLSNVAFPKTATSALSANVAGLLTAGVMTVGVQTAVGTGGGAAASAQTIGATVSTVLSAGVITSSCTAGPGSISGTSSIANLMIGGTPITVTGQPNQTISLGSAVGKVVINEQIRSSSATQESLDVNAIHVYLTALGTSLGLVQGDVIISHSSCVEAGPKVTMGTITGHIYSCANGTPTTTEVTGGSITVMQGSTTVKPAAPNPVSYTVPSGTYTLTAVPPAGYEFVACGGTGGGSTQNVTVPPGGTNGGGAFYVIPIPSAKVFVGYADNWNAAPGVFPSPWNGSPNTTFVGSAEQSTAGGACTANDCYDAGAIRIDNTSVAGETVTVTVDIGSGHHYALWGSRTVPSGGTLVLTQTSSDGTYDFDTSDTQSGCTNSGEIPIVTVTVNGVTTVYHDGGQVLDTGGTDMSKCPVGTNEGHAWAELTS